MTRVACSGGATGEWCAPEHPSLCPARCELEVEYGADPAPSDVEADGWRFDATFAVVNQRPSATGEDGDAALRSWQMSWTFDPAEGIASDAHGGWMTALRGDETSLPAAVLISPGTGGRPARVVNAFGDAGVIPAGGGRGVFAFSGVALDRPPPPARVSSVTLNGAPCEPLRGRAHLEADAEDPHPRDVVPCASPARRLFRYCCGPPLPAPPPPPATSSRAPSTIPTRAPLSPPSPGTSPPPTPPPTPPSLPAIARSSSRSLFDPATTRFALVAAAAILVVALAAFFADATRRRRWWGRARSLPTIASEVGRSPTRKTTLLLPGQVPARDDDDVEGVVLRGARGAGWVSVSTAGYGFETIAEASIVDANANVDANVDANAARANVEPEEADEVNVGDARASHLRLGELLGEGAYGTVHRATWHGPTFAAPVDVAVKTLRAAATPTRREARTFAREVAVLRRLDHPGVVRLLGASLAPHRAFILQELVPGGSLHDFIHGKPRGHPRDGRRLTRDESARVCGEVASAMAYLARRGVVHRDLKSQNVLLTSTRPDGPRGAKVADFGIAKSLAHATGGGEGWTVGGTAGGGCAGTPAWMAPELFRGVPEGGAGEASDVYSFGVVLWECMTGKMPWEDAASHVQIVFAVAVEGRRPPLPEEEDDEAGGGLRGLVARCWGEEPRSRPTFAEIDARLEEMRRRFASAGR